MGWEKLRDENLREPEEAWRYSSRIRSSLHGRKSAELAARSLGLAFRFEKKLYARQAEVFAGYAAYTDYEIGRVIQEVEDQGKLDNTLIIYICGDNGTSPEGTLEGTYNS